MAEKETETPFLPSKGKLSETLLLTPMPSGLFHPYNLDKSIFPLRGDWIIFISDFRSNFKTMWILIRRHVLQRLI